MLNFKKAIDALSKQDVAATDALREVCVVRVAQVPATDAIHGWEDSSLTKAGQADAATWASQLVDVDVGAVLCSDMTRATETAKIIGAAVGVEPTASDKLRPWDVGDLTGQHAAKMVATTSNFAKQAPDTSVPGGESFNAFRDRVFEGLAEALTKNADKAVVLVAHNSVKRLLHAWISEGQPSDHTVDVDEFFKRDRGASVSVIEISAAALAKATPSLAAALVPERVTAHGAEAGMDDADLQATRDEVMKYLLAHAPEVAAMMAKQQPGAGDVHVATTGKPKPKAKSFLSTIAEIKDGARVVAVPAAKADTFKRLKFDPRVYAMDRVKMEAAENGIDWLQHPDLKLVKGGRTLEQVMCGEDRALPQPLQVGKTELTGQALVDFVVEQMQKGAAAEAIAQAIDEGRIVDKQDAPPLLKPREDGMAHSPFPYDANAFANLRPDQVPRLLGALTDQDAQEVRSVRLATLVALQDRVDPDKVESMMEAMPDKMPLVVRFNSRNVIADGHHRLAAHYMNGDKAVDVRFKDLTAVDQAVKRDATAPDSEAETDWSIPFTVIKAVEDQQLVFGWASVSSVAGELVVDKQDDIIPEDELEQAAYEYVLYCRQQGDMHERMGVGRLVESMVFTKQKQEVLGIDLGMVGWFVGFKVDDPTVWKRIKKGELPEFSIGGKAVRMPHDS